MEKITNEQKAKEIATKWKAKGLPYNAIYDTALEAMQWKDEQHKDIEEGLRETINALDAKLQKANESGMYYFNQCNIQKQKLIDEACEWIKDNAIYYAHWERNGDTYAREIVFDCEECVEALKQSMEGE